MSADTEKDEMRLMLQFLARTVQDGIEKGGLDVNDLVSINEFIFKQSPVPQHIDSNTPAQHQFIGSDDC